MDLRAQVVTFGVKGGVPLGDPYSAAETRVDASYWTLGPTVEVRLTERLSVGFDAMYQPFRYRWSRTTGGAVFSEQSDVSRWELPVYAKYRLPVPGAARPFLAGGFVSGTNGESRVYECAGSAQFCPSPIRVESKSRRWGSGFVIGGGIEMQRGRVRIAPEVRYTHWVDGFHDRLGPGQTSLLLGIRF